MICNKYLIIAEFESQGFVLGIADSEQIAEKHVTRLSNIIDEYPFGEHTKIISKLEYIASYNIKGNQTFLESSMICSSNGSSSIYVVKINMNTFSLKSFIKERENLSSVFDYDLKDKEQEKKLDKIAKYNPVVIAN